MKVLVVAHGFPPAQSAGAEVYAAQTTRGLQARGHDVTVLAPTTAGDADDYDVRPEPRDDGLRVLRLTNRFGELYDLSWSYRNPRVDAALRDLLARERPDVVHVHHTIGTSSGVFDEARRAGAAVVVTLHDYWFLCPRGQRLMPNGHNCADIDPSRCAACIRKKRVSYAGHTARGWLAGRHPRAPSNAAARALTVVPELIRHAARELGDGAVRRRTTALLAALGSADAALAPSRFLLDEYARAGLDAKKLRHWPYGIDHAPFAEGARAPAADGRVRFVFVGSLQPSKGVELLVRAFASIPSSAARLTVHGAPAGAAPPGYREHLERLAGEGPADVTFAGPFDHGRIGALLAAADVAVVPSRWFENWPLALLESAVAGAAAVTTDHGGMREFADTFGTAVTFRADDVADLRRALMRFVDEPGLAQRLGAGNGHAVRTLDDDVDALVTLYEELAAARAAGDGT